ncbi:MAG: DUF2911 domain-containing protein, partial [Bryobacteraceae bacterium]
MLWRSAATWGIALLALAGCARAAHHVSPPATSSIEIAGDKIQVDYYAPAMYGRKIMGGLVPYNKVWCTGANWATKITTDSPLEIGGLKLSKGSYSIWTLPNPNEWTLIINKQTGQFHLYYDESRDFGRTKMNLRTLVTPVERFKIQLTQAGANRGVL